jgi:hypothetical protein
MLALKLYPFAILSLAPLTRSLDRLLIAVLASTVVLFVLGSGSAGSLRHAGSTGRWVGLVAFWLLSVGLAIRAGRRPLSIPAAVLFALTLPTFGLVSAAWSVDPKLTIQRSVSLGILVTAAAALAYAARTDKGVQRAAVAGIVVGASIAAVGGVVLLFAARHEAVQAASPGVPWRYRGLGENPNTFSMLAAVVLPLALGLLLTASRRSVQVVTGAAALFLFGSVLMSGSRGAFLAAVGGMITVAVLRGGERRRRLVATGAAVVAAVIGFVLAVEVPRTPSVPRTPVAAVTPHSVSTPSAASRVRVRVRVAVDTPGRMSDEVGRPATATLTRNLLGSSGRIQAWLAGIHQASARPLLGFGFGTEERVFIDRVYSFQGSRVENTWVGLALQLGVVGVALLAAMWLSLGWSTIRARPWRWTLEGSLASAILGACIAGLLHTVWQSYLYSVGNVATVTVWVCLLLLAVAAAETNEETA